MAEPHPVGSMLALADVVLPGVVITRSARTIQVDATDATAAQWATAMEWVADRAPEEARCDMFCDDTREVWHFSW